ncbi:Uncharacterised protein [Mycoplasmopsis fermentans]|uniref:Uncharacterized protein n=1 Tax=Mycoplasmopsis fermentans (strain M64) TaxID=943945 RepID=A0AB32XAG5_MYCFM|nr:Hypothetical Protein MfeM64YM_0013 [Mycoplasmopsis fermentans M64]VEU60058.1 Uncharacterised protein [Mycoplasmopsis fermentans]
MENLNIDIIFVGVSLGLIFKFVIDIMLIAA